MIFLLVFIFGLPRSLWCIPAFIALWGLSGASSGGSSGMGDNIGYMLLPFVMLAIALWGAYSNIRRSYAKLSTSGSESDNGK